MLALTIMRIQLAAVILVKLFILKGVNMKSLVLSMLLLAFTPVVGFSQTVAEHLQNVSVTVHTNTGSGSGVVITRNVKVKPTDTETVKANFVWTAAHVVDGLRSVRTIVDPKTGTERKVVEFAPAFLVKELVENGRKVGEVKMEARVIKYSDADTNEDLALLMILKRDFVTDSAKFYLDGDKTPKIGDELIHVGSLLGQGGANSMTTGIISQVGRTINLSGGNVVVFDQTTCPAFPGSSGGGVFLKDGKYIGMLVRGAGETFNLIVPVRRIHSFAEKHNILWALDETLPVPSLEELSKISPDDAGTAVGNGVSKSNDGMMNLPATFEYIKE
jgi:S1-C subfamily serine protease